MRRYCKTPSPARRDGNVRHCLLRERARLEILPNGRERREQLIQKPAPSGPTATIAPAIESNPRTAQGSIKCPFTAVKIQGSAAASKYKGILFSQIFRDFCGL